MAGADDEDRVTRAIREVEGLISAATDQIILLPEDQVLGGDPQLYSWLLKWLAATEMLWIAAENAFPDRIQALTAWEPLSRDADGAQALRCIQHVETTIARLTAWATSPARPSVAVPTAQPLVAVFTQGERHQARATYAAEFATATSSILISDPYVTRETLDLLLFVSQEIEVRILTSTEYAVSPFPIEWANWKKRRHKDCECRTAPTQSLPHDRFLLLDQQRLLQSGASVKDVGLRVSTLVEITDASAATRLRDHLSLLWATATSLP